MTPRPILIFALDDALNRSLADQLARAFPDQEFEIRLAPLGFAGSTGLRRRIGRAVAAAKRRALGVREFRSLLALLPPERRWSERLERYVRQNMPEITVPDSGRGAPPVTRLVDGSARPWPEEDPPELVIALGVSLGGLPVGTRVLTYYPVRLPEGRPGDPAALAIHQARPDRLGATVTVRESGVERIVGVWPARREMGESFGDAEGESHRVGFFNLIETVRAALDDGLPADLAPVEKPARSLAARSFIHTCARIQHAVSRRPWPGLHESMADIPAGPRFGPRIRGVSPGVYIFCYHSIVDPARMSRWESCYSNVATTVRQLESHLRFLSQTMEPLELADAPDVLARGPAERPYFVVTFDDGYENLARNAEPICRALGLRPTVFANASFASQENVYYRLLLSIILREGHGAAAATAFNEAFRTGDFTERNLLSVSKRRYRLGLTEDAARDAWRRAYGDEDLPRAHLSFEDLGRLCEAGWTIGNHTLHHPSLSRVGSALLSDEIGGNQKALRKQGLDPIPWLAYPNGRAVDVDDRVARWLEGTTDTHGLFAAGGVNIFPSRTEWMRIPVGDLDLGAFRRMIRRNIELTWQVCRRLYPFPGVQSS